MPLSAQHEERVLAINLGPFSMMLQPLQPVFSDDGRPHLSQAVEIRHKQNIFFGSVGFDAVLNMTCPEGLVKSTDPGQQIPTSG